MKHLSMVLSLIVLFAGVGLLFTVESKGATEHRFLNVPGRNDNNPYSNAVLVGDTLYLAGDIGWERANGDAQLCLAVRRLDLRLSIRLDRGIDLRYHLW